MHNTTTIGDLLQRPTGEGALEGRESELRQLDAMLHGERPLVTFVTGIPGIGKSALLNAFASRARGCAGRVVLLDGNRLQPTPSGFLRAVANQLDVNPQSLAEDIATLGGPLLLAIDNYEALRLLDRWLRDTFLPGMPASLRVVIATGRPPGPGWTAREPWSALTACLELQPLTPAAAVQYLLGRGFSIAQAQHVNATTHGNPMALVIASSTHGNWANRSPSAIPASGWLARLADAYLESIASPHLRQLVRELALLRRVTRPILAFLRPDEDDEMLFERLRPVPLIVPAGDGLAVHDAVRDVLAASLVAENPVRAREVRRGAWSLLAAALKDAHDNNLWRYTADTIYLLSDPVVREAFFPALTDEHEVAPATAQMAGVILDIARQHENEAASALLEMWWKTAPEAFRVVLDAAGVVQGFYLAFDPARVPRTALRSDPLAAGWVSDMRESRMPSQQRALFIRRWLARETGEAPGAIQAAAWLDLKRTYLEMAPDLRRVYLGVIDPGPYAGVAGRLGFAVPAALARVVGNDRYTSAVLDMGPASVSGWLHRLLARELGIDPHDFLDPERQAVVLSGTVVPLTPLEFKVAAYLHANAGVAVSREHLRANVWGHRHDGASNVVDAVIRTLRRKLGERAGCIRTVRGHGYRLVLDP